MTPVESGPSTERIVRNLLLLLILVIFAAAFLLDGFFGYAYNNVHQLAKSLGKTDEPLPKTDLRLTAEAGRRHGAEIAAGTPRDEVAQRLGPPAFRLESEEYYVGPGGHLRAQYNHDRLTSIDWIDGIHSETDIAWQRWIGFVLTAFAGGLAVSFSRVLRGRVRVTDEWLQIDKAPPVACSSIRRIYLDPESVKGRVLIECESEGRPGAYILDAYRVKHLDAVIDALQQATGIEPTYPPMPDEKD